MKTTTELLARFRKAFARYRAADARLRMLRAELPANSESSGIHGINAQFGVLAKAERNYHAERSRYADRLLQSQPHYRGESMTKIYVGNLEPGTTEVSVRSLFEIYGNVDRIRMSAQRNAAHSGTFAFIEMGDQAASDAIEALHGSVRGAQSLRVIRARPVRPVSRESAD